MSRNYRTVDNSGRHWTMQYSNAAREFWKSDDGVFYAVCLPNDDPDHSTFTVTMTLGAALSWFDKATIEYTIAGMNECWQSAR